MKIKEINIKLLQKVLINEVEVNASTQLADYEKILCASGRTEISSRGNKIVFFNSCGISVLTHANSDRVASLRIRFSELDRADLPLCRFAGEIETQSKALTKDGWMILDDFAFYNFLPVGRAAFPFDSYTLWLVTSEFDKIDYIGISWGIDAKSFIRLKE